MTITKLFEKSWQFELVERKKYDCKDGLVAIKGNGYTRSSLGNIDKLIACAEKRKKEIIATSKTTVGWKSALSDLMDNDSDEKSCLTCSL